MQLRYRAAASVILAAAAIVLCFRLTFRPARGDVAPGQHVVAISVPPGRDAAEYEETVDQIANALAALPEIRRVEHRLPDPEEFIEALLPRFTLLLTPAELERVGERLTTASIQASVRRNRTVLETPQAMATKQLVQHDPFNLLPIFLEKFGGGGGLEFDPTSGLLQSKDSSTILILARPHREPDDLQFARSLVAKSRALINAPEASLTGDYVVALEDARLAHRWAAGSVAGLVLLLALSGWLARRRTGAATAALIASSLSLAVVAAAALAPLPLPLPEMPGNRERQRETAIERRFGGGGETKIVTLEAPSLDEVLEKTAAATSRMPAGTWAAATQFLPSRSQQLAAIAALQAGRADRFSAGRIAADFRAALTASGFRPDAYDEYLELFSRALEIDDPVPPEEFSEPVLEPVRDRFLRQTASGYQSLIYLDLK